MSKFQKALDDLVEAMLEEIIIPHAKDFANYDEEELAEVLAGCEEEGINLLQWVVNDKQLGGYGEALENNLWNALRKAAGDAEFTIR